MQTTVKVAELLDILKKNRDEHMATYEEAVKEYTKKLSARLDEIGDALKLRANALLASTDPLNTDFRQIDTISLPVPEQHKADFDKVIRMMELNIEPTITLEEFEFNQYVMNEWAWQRQFLASTASYTNAASPRK